MTEIIINGVTVDLYDEVPWSLNFSIADIRTPEKRNTSYSKTISLPASKQNDILFSHIFDISKESLSDGVLNFSPDFNPNKKAPCQIYSDSLLQLNGYAQLLKITSTGDVMSYEIAVFGQLADVLGSFEDKKLSDIDLSEYNHELTLADIQNSWGSFIKKNGVPFTNFTNLPASFIVVLYDTLTTIKFTDYSGSPVVGDMVYTPTIKESFVITNRSVAGPDVTITIDRNHSEGVGLTNLLYIGNDSIPTGEGYVYPAIHYGYSQSNISYDVAHMYPSIYAKTFIDKMFAAAKSTYTSTFFNSERFKRFTIPFNGDVIKLTQAQIDARTFEVNKTVNQNVNNPIAGSKIFVTFNNEVSDPSGIFSLNTFAPNKKGTYDLIVGLNILYTGGMMAVYMHVYDSSGNVKRGITLKGITTLTAEINEQYVAAGVDLEVGDKVRIFVYIPYTMGVSLTIKSGSFFKNKPVNNPITTGDEVQLNAAIPKDISQKDFFLSIVRMFNLYVIPDPDNENNLIIKTQTEFYEGNKVIDWTGKLDTSMPIEIRPVSEIEGKDYTFSYKEDKDYYNAKYKTEFQEIYGNRKISIDNDFVKGAKDIGVIFSPSPGLGNAINDIVTPAFIKQDEDGTVSPIAVNIRLVYYGGLKYVSGTMDIKQNATTYGFNMYPYCGHVDDPYNPTFDLSFDVPLTLYWTTPLYTTANIYNLYYKQFIEEITDKDSKILRAYLRLRNTDIFLLDFRNFLQIDGINYRLNKVLDFDPLHEETCIVELSKIKAGFAFIPSDLDIDPPIFDNLIQGGLNEVRSLTATSYIQLIQGGLDEVQGIGSSPIKIINGGRD